MNKSDMFLFAQKYLKKIYLNKIKMIISDNHLEIDENNQSFLITTKNELKQYFRNKISSNNLEIENYLINLFKNRYEMNEKELKILNEIYPNIDILISAYISLMRENDVVDLSNYNYEELLEYLVNKYIKKLINKIEIEKKEYQKLMLKFENIQNDINNKKEELEHYKIVKINRLYYETYKNTNMIENKKNKEKMQELGATLVSAKDDLRSLNKEYKELIQKEKQSNRGDKRRTKKLEECIKEIIMLKEKINCLNEEKDLLKQAKNVSDERNKEAFLKYTTFQSISIETFKKYYNIHKNNNGIHLLKQIQNEERKLIEISDKIKECQYVHTGNTLKFFCKDNLDIVKTHIDMNPVITKSIIDILNQYAK